MRKNQIQKIKKKEPIMRELLRLFFDTSNRPKKTPLHLSLIQRRLEKQYHPWQVNEALKKMKRAGVLSSQKSRTKFIKRIIFYYPSDFDNIEEKGQIYKKIQKSCHWIEKYSNPKITSAIGKHLHALIKAELRAQGFRIIEEGKVRSYNGIQWTDSRHSLDMVVQHSTKNMVYGIEVKNTLDIINKKEVRIKIMMCKKFGIMPLFACRWLKPHIKEIENNNGFAWEFGVQLYPLGMDELIKRIQKRFGFRMKVSSELPEESVVKFEEYLKSFR